MKNFTLGFVVLAGFVATMVAFSVYSGYVFSWLWQWFAVPMGLHPISVPVAIGICLLIRTPNVAPKKEGKEFHETLFSGLILNTLAWGVGYIAHLFA